MLRRLRTWIYGEEIIITPDNIERLFNLPQNTRTLCCANLGLVELPASLPPKMEVLECSNNLLTHLPPLPPNLKELYCDSNMLTELPTLPRGITKLSCFSNRLWRLPELPNKLRLLSCYNNQISRLPALPASMTHILFINNPLVELPPEIPRELILPYFPQPMMIFDFDETRVCTVRYSPPAEKTVAEECPICMVDPVSVQTQCGHDFCRCLVENYCSTRLNAELCPLCRSPISEMVFIDAEVMREYLARFPKRLFEVEPHMGEGKSSTV